MNSPALRSIALTLLLTAGCVCLGALVAAPVAEAAGVRPQVGKPLQAAIALANKGNASAAMSDARLSQGMSGWRRSRLLRSRSCTS